MQKATHIEDLRRRAESRVPRMFYDYADSGSYTEATYRNNQNDFSALEFRQRIMVDMADRTLQTEMIGQPVKMPLALAPIGLLGMQYADGEILAARAANAFGVPFTLSTMSICSIEDVARHTDQPFWFQLYVMRDRAFIANLINRAKAARCSALVLTADLQILGQRHKDIKNGLTVPPKPTLPNLLNLATKLRWCAAMAKTPRRSFGNLTGQTGGVSDMGSLSAWTASQFDPSLSWDDVSRIKDLWGGKLIIKGVMEPEDARSAVAAGADAIVVSNHGGRQLDGAPSSIRALPAIVEAVGQATEVYMDGGIRSGQDILKAVALGARAVMVGRAFVYGLGAGGQAGVSEALELLYREMDVTMAFCGLRDVKAVDRRILRNKAILAV
jgi:L-lactate dehydrogenase (cytochrome)